MTGLRVEWQSPQLDKLLGDWNTQSSLFGYSNCHPTLGPVNLVWQQFIWIQGLLFHSGGYLYSPGTALLLPGTIIPLLGLFFPGSEQFNWFQGLSFTLRAGPQYPQLLQIFPEFLRTHLPESWKIPDTSEYTWNETLFFRYLFGLKISNMHHYYLF